MTRKLAKLLACLVALTMLVGLAACTPTASPSTSATGGETSSTDDSQGGETSSTDSSNQELYQIEMFNTYANYMGIQGGWFGKIIKDRFNIELNIIAPQVAGTGDALYQTRSAAGNLGDIIVQPKSRMADCFTAGLLMDMSPYLDDCPNLQALEVAYTAAADVIRGGEGVYAIPGRVSNLPLDEPAGRGINPEQGVFLRWDWYYELGAPEIADMDGLLDVLAQMQEAHPTNENGDKVYALSAFKDWDGGSVRAAREMLFLYGQAGVQGWYSSNYDGSEVINYADDGGLYYQMLQWWNKAYRMGLVDPDSSTQNWDMIASKANDGRICFSWWTFLGANIHGGTYDPETSNPGYALVPIQNSVISNVGYNQYGLEGNAFAMGSSAKYPERIMEFLDYYASPEGILETNSRIEGVTYEMIDGRPVLTEFALSTDPNKEAPEEMGGGLWSDGACQINYPLVHADDINPILGEPTNSSLWSSTLESGVNTFTEQWAEVYGTDSPLDYLETHDMIQVVPGTDYTTPSDPSDIQTMRAQLNELFTATGWQMIYAESDSEFETLWNDMKAQLPDFGFNEVDAYDKAIVDEIIAARQEVLGK